MSKIIPQLSDLLQNIGLKMGYGSDNVTLSASNVDSVFMILRSRGIKEVKVSPEEMFMVIFFFLANSGQNDYVLRRKLLRTGEIDMFYGVKLKLK